MRLQISETVEILIFLSKAAYSPVERIVCIFDTNNEAYIAKDK